jgi:hypothetical protein
MSKRCNCPQKTACVLDIEGKSAKYRVKRKKNGIFLGIFTEFCD